MMARRNTAGGKNAGVVVAGKRGKQVLVAWTPACWFFVLCCAAAEVAFAKQRDGGELPIMAVEVLEARLARRIAGEVCRAVSGRVWRCGLCYAVLIGGLG